MNDFVKRYKREIIVGVTASIIATLIVSFGNWLISAAPKLGSSILATVLNVIYTLAATHTSSSLTILILCGFIGGSLGTIAPPVYKRLRTFKKTLMIERALKAFSEDQIKELNERMNSDDQDWESQKEQETAVEIIKAGKRSGFETAKSIIILALCYIFIILFVLVPVQLYEKFEQNVTIIYPYVEEREIFRLKSDWAQMRSSDDYAVIYEYINRVKEENSLLLR